MLHPQKPLRSVTAKRWQNLALAGVTSLTACSLAATSLAAATPGLFDPTAPSSPPENVWLAQAQGGEGGEGGSTAGATAAEADARYLAALGQIEGSLRVGVALFLDGEAMMAKPHMKHPEDQIYAELAPALASRGVAGFAEALTTLAQAVESEADATTVKDAFATVSAGIARARAAQSAPRPMFDAMMILLRDAGDDYAAALENGSITDMHEYQDAWGYVQVARAMAEALILSADPVVAKAAQKALDAITATDAAFAGLAPQGKTPGDAALFLGAAARVELAALKVK